MTWDSTNDDAVDIQAVTATGCALGDIILGISVDKDIVDAAITGHVTAANVITLVCVNEGGSTFNPGATTVRILVADCT